jgi:hypothetical protein
MSSLTEAIKKKRAYLYEIVDKYGNKNPYIFTNFRGHEEVLINEVEHLEKRMAKLVQERDFAKIEKRNLEHIIDLFNNFCNNCPGQDVVEDFIDFLR